MLKTIVPARLEFDGGVPFSAAYGDVHYPAEGGAGQARHVFLAGCGLPEAWAQRERYVVLETGFGTGLNFLATWAAWRADPARCRQLHFLSVEKHPLAATDLARVHARWPEFADLSQELGEKWPMLMPGFHRISLDGGRVQLTLMLGDAASCLPEVDAAVDAFYLGGCASEHHPDLCQPALFATLAKLARPGAAAATDTVAAPVRQGLSDAGFACEKRAGFGRQRHCLAARYQGRGRSEASPVPRHAIVVGAGVAGAAVAHALASRGVAVTVLERAVDFAQGASGNPVGVFRPLVSRDDNRASRLTRAAFLHDLANWPQLAGLAWSRCGVLHLAKDVQAAEKQRAVLAGLAPPADYARWVELDEARSLANWPVAMPGTYYPTAGWIAPATLCRALLAHPQVALRTAHNVTALEPGDRRWRVLGEGGAVLAEADAVVLANARDALALAPGEPWPLHSVRGQITRLPAGSLPEITRVIAREGYVAPGVGQPLVGATYEHDDEDVTPRAASDQSNLARLEAILPGAAAGFGDVQLLGRASLRATLPDRLPLVGAVPRLPGVYVAAGYASRGVVWAGILGEALAARMTGEPLPLEADLMGAVSPARFG